MRNKILVLLIIISFTFLTGCISRYGPIYIEEIEVYENGELQSGSFKYYDGRTWIDYDGKPTKEKIYYVVDIEGGDLEAVFKIYSTKTVVNEMKITLSKNLDSNTNISEWADVLEKEDTITKCNYEFTYDSSFNTIRVYGWLTNNGPKYVGAKAKDSNYTIWGVHFNLIKE